MQVLEEGPEPVYTHPEADEIVDADRGQCGPREGVNVILSARWRRGLGYRNLQFPGLITQLLSIPKADPAGVVDLTTKAGRLAVGLELEPVDIVSIRLNRYKAVERRPNP